MFEERHIRALLDSTVEGIYGLDERGLCTFCNAAAVKMLGYDAEEQLLGRNMHELIHHRYPDGRPYPEQDCRIYQALRRGQPAQCDDEVLWRADGTSFAAEYRSHLIAGNRGVVVTFVDISERKALEQHLKHVNSELERRNEEVEAFVYIVSHDLRAPLVNIQGFCKELELSCRELKELLPDPEGELRRILEQDIPGSLEFIASSTDRFERLIDALLRLSRTGRRELVLEVLDLEKLVQSVVKARESSLREIGAELKVFPLPRAWGDQTALEQVFSNLVDNAVRYRDPERRSRIVVGGESEGKTAHPWVQDNGLGIPESARARLFQVFSRFHPDRAPGEGMGLTIVKRIVERLQGEIWVESRPGDTTFHLRLPGEEHHE